MGCSNSSVIYQIKELETRKELELDVISHSPQCHPKLLQSVHLEGRLAPLEVIPMKVTAPFAVPDDIGDDVFKSMRNSPHRSPSPEFSKESSLVPCSQDEQPDYECHEEYIKKLEMFIGKVETKPERLARRVAMKRRVMMMMCSDIEMLVGRVETKKGVPWNTQW